MSMSTHIVGVCLPDEKWKKMKAIWDACHAASIRPPEEVNKYFENDTPDDAGIIIPLEETRSVHTYGEEGCESFEVDISKLPAGIVIIRFYNSY